MKKLILLICLLVSHSVHADVNDELRRLRKCYGILVREPILSSDPLFVEVKSGVKNGTVACMEVFDKALLQSDNQVARDNTGKHNEIGMKVIASLNNFHMTYVGVPQAPIDEVEPVTPDIADLSEHVYHLTYVALKPAERFDRLVTRPGSLKAVRVGNPRQRHLMWSYAVGSGYSNLFNFGKYWTPDPANNYGYTDIGSPTGAPFLPTPVATGKLVGVEPLNHVNLVQNQNMFVGKDGFAGSFYLYGDVQRDINANQHFGAGVIGTQSYIKANANLAKLIKFSSIDGAVDHYRTWGKSVVEDFLCRELPSLRSTDVAGDVFPTSTIPFRKGISCMQCHATMDTAAGTIRNVRSTLTASYKFNKTSSIFSMPVLRPSDPSSSTVSPDLFYAVRPPEGALRFRSYDGSLTQTSVSNLSQLGAALASTNDLYACAAKKYYKFLTGISVDLSDQGALGAPTLSSGEIYHRQKVIQYGTELKSNQSVRDLIKKIIESPTFIYPTGGV